jgi:hypothetical protein
MKTAKLVLSILGVSLATLSFGQLLSLQETNRNMDLQMARIMEPQDEVLFYSTAYNAENGRIMHWVHHDPTSSFYSVTSNAPVVSRTYFHSAVKPLYEEVPVLETWMTIPFKSSLEDRELEVEDWMKIPFEAAEFDEKELEIEPWMMANWI